MTQPRNLIAAAILCAALVATTAACTPDDPTPSPTATTATPTPTPTPTPTRTPTVDARQQRIEDAKAAYVAYTAAVNDVMQNSGAGATEKIIAPYVSGDLRPRLVSYYQQVVDQGLRQTGATKIASLEVVSDDGTIVLDACLDNSGVDVVDPTGKSVLLPGFPSRLVTVETLRQQDDGRWTLVRSETDQARPC
jgi:type V secretory pathway adhesin AidA